MKFGCPLCDATIVGDNEKVLSAELRDHLAAAHKLNMPEMRKTGSDMGKGKLAFGTKQTVMGKKGEGAFGAEEHGKAHLKERSKKGASGPQKEISVRCPFCDARVEGADSDEETNLLKKHMVVEHGIPLM